jgi:uncharacterized tellurite resistance protein B-like protein
MMTDSKFHVWRCLFALVHADDVVADEERDFMTNVLNNFNFSDEQKSTLENDAENKQDPIAIFEKITEERDQKLCLNMAYDIVLIDGEYHDKEYAVMQQLQACHDRNTGQISEEDFDAIIQRHMQNRSKSYDEVLQKGSAA